MECTSYAPQQERVLASESRIVKHLHDFTRSRPEHSAVHRSRKSNAADSSAFPDNTAVNRFLGIRGILGIPTIPKFEEFHEFDVATVDSSPSLANGRIEANHLIANSGTPPRNQPASPLAKLIRLRASPRGLRQLLRLLFRARSASRRHPRDERSLIEGKIMSLFSAKELAKFSLTKALVEISNQSSPVCSSSRVALDPALQVILCDSPRPFELFFPT